MIKSNVAAVLDELSVAEEEALVTLLDAEFLALEDTQSGQEAPAKTNKVSSRWEDQSGKLVCRWVFED
jgi:hypothetical protein